MDRLLCGCAGSLITNKHVLTAFHCVWVGLGKEKKEIKKQCEQEGPCTPIDFSKGKDLSIFFPPDLLMEYGRSTNTYIDSRYIGKFEKY